MTYLFLKDYNIAPHAIKEGEIRNLTNDLAKKLIAEKVVEKFEKKKTNIKKSTAIKKTSAKKNKK